MALHMYLTILFAKRQLDICYPRFPLEQELSCCIQSVGKLEQLSQGGKLWLLDRFSMEWQRLQCGGVLLPDLVEFYQWIHTNISYLLTYDEASSIAIGQIIELAERNSSREIGKHLRTLYERMTEKYNKYIELNEGIIGAGACAAVHRDNPISTIKDSVPLLHFLTGNIATIDPFLFRHYTDIHPQTKRKRIKEMTVSMWL